MTSKNAPHLHGVNVSDHRTSKVKSRKKMQINNKPQLNLRRYYLT
jgi:hypothetical protein